MQRIIFCRSGYSSARIRERKAYRTHKPPRFAHNSRVRSFLIAYACVFVIFGCMLLPIRARAFFAGGGRGGRGEICVRWLFVRVRLPFRVRILDAPPACIELLERDGMVKARLSAFVRKVEKSTLADAALDAIVIESIALDWHIGLSGETQTTALLCGFCECLTRELLSACPKTKSARIFVRALPVWDADVYSLNLEGIVFVRAADIIKEYLRKRSFMRKACRAVFDEA